MNIAVEDSMFESSREEHISPMYHQPFASPNIGKVPQKEPFVLNPRLGLTIPTLIQSQMCKCEHVYACKQHKEEFIFLADGVR